MEDEIITKLRSALAESIQKECQVIYILVEIRKLLEQSSIKKDFSVLNFYCNWVLHSEISKTSSIYDLLERIAKEIFSKGFTIIAMLDFEKFREEICLFLNNLNLNNPFIDVNYWKDFRKEFIEVLVDCPLKPNYGNVEEFRFIKSTRKTDIDFEIKIKNHKSIKGSFTFLNF